jgi:hypothetical protein
MGAWDGPAGGIRYHWRALRHRRRLWGGFTAALDDWLDAWRPPARRLLLIGPSAGWCLPARFLERFAHIDVLEPDPLARLLLARRFRALAPRLRQHATDYLGPRQGRFATAPLERLASDFPEAAVLFCNLLGQVAYLDPAAAESPSFAPWKAALARVLAGRDWASFHDRLSGPVAPQLAGLSALLPAGITNDELVARFYATAAGGELEDHGTADLFPALPRRFLAWQIVPERHHLIEAVRGDGA